VSTRGASLSAMAVRTERVRLGTLLTPLPWRRPWKVASQVATLDQLSSGRAILTVGLGVVAPDLPGTGEVDDLRERAAMLDDGIDAIRDLWEGRASHRGPVYAVEFDGTEQLEVARSVQDRVPIWVVGLRPRPKSMRRVLRCDSIVPQYDVGDRKGSPADVVAMRAWLEEQGARPDLDVIAEGETPAADPHRTSDVVGPWADAGCTWWLEIRWELPHDSAERMAEVRTRLEAGPPTLP
jgi:Luciferase-like monooxygenase